MQQAAETMVLCFTKLSVLGIIPAGQMARRRPMELPEICDLQGGEQDWDWLVAAFGAVKLERAEVPEGTGRIFA